MARITLDSIREAADAKYGSLDIELSDKQGDVVRLLNPLRMSEEQRKEVSAIQKKFEALEKSEESDEEELSDEEAADAVAEQTAAVKEMILAVAENKTAGQKLLDALDGDLALVMAIFEEYTEGTQLGEASPSQN